MLACPVPQELPRLLLEAPAVDGRGCVVTAGPHMADDVVVQWTEIDDSARYATLLNLLFAEKPNQ